MPSSAYKYSECLKSFSFHRRCAVRAGPPPPHSWNSDIPAKLSHFLRRGGSCGGAARQPPARRPQPATDAESISCSLHPSSMHPSLYSASRTTLHCIPHHSAVSRSRGFALPRCNLFPRYLAGLAWPGGGAAPHNFRILSPRPARGRYRGHTGLLHIHTRYMMTL